MSNHSQLKIYLSLSGMSSLGLLSDFSAMMTVKSPQAPRVVNPHQDKVTQTLPGNGLVDISVATDKVITQDESVQVGESTHQEMETQTEPKISKEAQVQVELLVENKFESQEKGDAAYCNYYSKSNDGNLDEVETLYTYKVDLSPVKNGPQQMKNCSSCKYSKSSPDLVAKLSQNENKEVNNVNDDQLFKLPNEELYAKVRKAVPVNRASRTKLSHLNKESVTSSTSSIDQVDIPLSTDYARSLPRVRQSLRKDVADVSKILDGILPNIEDDLSSPDLGIGDSDHDLNSSLRAYLTLYKYQLLRHQINEATTLLSGMESVNRDYAIRLISADIYEDAISQSLLSLINIVRSSKKLCSQFTIEDSNSLYSQLESMRSRKENMERAITRQLKKTDKLLKKAKVNLKEN